MLRGVIRGRVASRDALADPARSTRSPRTRGPARRRLSRPATGRITTRHLRHLCVHRGWMRPCAIPHHPVVCPDVRTCGPRARPRPGHALRGPPAAPAWTDVGIPAARSASRPRMTDCVAAFCAAGPVSLPGRGLRPGAGGRPSLPRRPPPDFRRTADTKARDMTSRTRAEHGWIRLAMAIVLGMAVMVGGAVVANGGAARRSPRRARCPRSSRRRFPTRRSRRTRPTSTASTRPGSSRTPRSAPTTAPARTSPRTTARRHGHDQQHDDRRAVQHGHPDAGQHDDVGRHGPRRPVAGPQGQPVPVVRGPRRRQHRRRQAHRGPDVRLAAGGEHRQRRDHEDRLRHRRHPGRHRRPGAPGHRPDQRPERPLRPRPEPGPALQRRRPEPDDPRRHRLPDVRAADRPGDGRRPAVPADQPAQARGRRAPLPQLRRRGRHPAAGQRRARARRGQRTSSARSSSCRASPTARPTDPDPRQQAPFEVGDHITYSGTLMHARSGDYISAHTIEANVGIYTQPGTQPSYLAIGEFGVGSADPNATAVNGVAQETQDRIFLESETTDVETPVDIYMDRRRPAHRGRHEPLDHAVGDDRREPDRQPDGRHHDAVHRRPAAARPPAGDEGPDRAPEPADAHDPGRRPLALHAAAAARPVRSSTPAWPTRRRWPTASSPASTRRRRSSSSSPRT